jgi:pilus assembly protein CpaF
MADFFNKISNSNGDSEATVVEKEKLRLKVVVQTKLPNYLDGTNVFGVTDPERIEVIKKHMRTILAQTNHSLKNYEVKDLIASLILDITSLGKLSPLMDDPTITEIMINGPKEIFVERKGKVVKSEIEYDNDSELLELATRIARNIGRMIDTSHPTVDARLPDGSRVHIIIPPLARKGVTITIRKFSKEKLTINDLISFETINYEMAKFLRALVYSKANLVVSGGTGSGKTTTLNVLSNFIPQGVRVITIEDSAELQLSVDHVVSLETKNANAEGLGEININRLVKETLRMRPDRIILGEVRDHTAYDLMNAMNTGHEGSMSTIHANDPESCITRISNLIKEKPGMGYTDETVENLIGQSLDAIVQISRTTGGARKITYISLVDQDKTGKIEIINMYKHHPVKGFERTGERITKRIHEKFIEAGVKPDLFN